MSKIPFQVSARAARLIGRENVANAEGAIIELIKNSYDADADYCVVFFDNEFEQVPQKLTPELFEVFSKESDLIKGLYDSNYALKKIDDDKKDELLAYFHSKRKIYIMDNGIGMDEEVITNHWMTIGTNYKELEFQSAKGRIRAGAKGIGRFALDRLGEVGEMFTKKENKEGFEWNVNWNDFEDTNAIIGKVYADIEPNNNLCIPHKIEENVSLFYSSHKELKEIIKKNYDTNSGTIIKISNIRDNWTKGVIEHLFENLQTLIPPKEEKIFDIFLLNSMIPTNYGHVEASVCEDFDYKLEAIADDNQNMKITIYRKEFDIKSIDENYFFNHKNIKEKHQYKKEIFEEEIFSYNRTFAQLLSIDENDKGIGKELKKIGAFSFSFYFLKQSLTERDRKKYKQKRFNSSFRKEWMKKFGGVKLFRDNFRVRPYGEKGTNGFDWLQIGNRSSGTTNKPSTSGWKVRPNMVAGVVNISRIENIDFKDKSNREGLQENESFKIFKEILIALIREFEKDRYPIMQAFADLQINEEERELAKKQAEDVIKGFSKKKKRAIEKSLNDNKKTLIEKLKSSQDDTEKMINAYKIQKEEREEIISENKVLRLLASTGLIVTAFTHELKTIQNNLGNRVDAVIKILNDGLLDKEKLNKLPNFKNPIRKLGFIKEQDGRLKQWLDFALNAIKRDKRRRKNIELVSYFDELKLNWHAILEAKGIEFKIDTGIWLEIIWKGFIIDLDSIFNNLIVNSTEAFKRRGFSPTERIIQITVNRNFLQENSIHIIYEDSGPGLLETIVDANEIFDFNFSTKKDSGGRATGTGIGMWLVQSIIDDYEGKIEILRERPKFKIKFTIPIKIKKHE